MTSLTTIEPRATTIPRPERSGAKDGAAERSGLDIAGKGYVGSASRQAVCFRRVAYSALRCEKLPIILPRLPTPSPRGRVLRLALRSILTSGDTRLRWMRRVSVVEAVSAVEKRG